MAALPEVAGWKLRIKTPAWSEPLFGESRYKGAKGGRSSGKSHFFAERLIERAVCEPKLRWACVREIQKSLKFSAKTLLEDKIKELGVGHMFSVTDNEIRRRGSSGVLIFQGLQDHTAESIKSLEGFDGVWIEEAQSISKRSLDLLDPTIRKDGSEVWASWNPDQPTDAIEQLFLNNAEAVVVHVNYLENPWCTGVTKSQAKRTKLKDYEAYAHIWLGGYNTRSEAQIFRGYWRVDDFIADPDVWAGPYYGMDFGFAKDPTCLVRCWINDNVLYIDYDKGKVGLDIDKTAPFFTKDLPTLPEHAVRGDSARPETISYLKKNGIPRIVGVDKWPGSVVDGIEFIKSFDEIVIHTDCTEMQDEAMLYSFKIDRKTDEPLPEVAKGHDHRWDAVRYALGKLIKRRGDNVGVFVRKKRGR